jgi:hypothetical protein
MGSAAFVGKAPGSVPAAGGSAIYRPDYRVGGSLCPVSKVTYGLPTEVAMSSTTPNAPRASVRPPPEFPAKGGRRNGSILAALLVGVGLVVAAIWSFSYYASKPDHVILHRSEGLACLAFAGVLFWWVWSPPGIRKPTDPAAQGQQPDQLGAFYSNRNWGIGFETVTMVVGVVAAVIAIFTLTAEYDKEKPAPNSVMYNGHDRLRPLAVAARRDATLLPEATVQKGSGRARALRRARRAG